MCLSFWTLLSPWYPVELCETQKNMIVEEMIRSVQPWEYSLFVVIARE